MKTSDEPFSSLLKHVILPTGLAVLAGLISLYFDLMQEEPSFWFQRSGALLGAVGIYIAFHEGKWRITTKDSSLFINTEIWYQWLALVLGILGTLIWAYGDIPFK